MLVTHICAYVLAIMHYYTILQLGYKFYFYKCSNHKVFSRSENKSQVLYYS